MSSEPVSWPDIFPSPTIDSYTITPEESIARTTMEAGVARQRQRYTAVPSKVRVRWVMSDEIFRIFESWYQHKAKAGAEWVLIKLKNGLGFLDNEVRFFEPYTAKLLTHDTWEVRTSLEAREMQVLSVGTLELLLIDGFTDDGLRIVTRRLDNLINEALLDEYPW